LIQYKAIGFVEREGPPSRNLPCRVVILEEFVEGLLGIEEFSHLILIYHLHEVKEWSLLKEVRGFKVGVFATRSPRRPNPVGISVVTLLGREGNKLEVVGLNAVNGTPVIDLKPYDRWDSVQEPKVAPWHPVQ
jgi:tRNA-Thr(GGU) m(6)t(6)A37 methyltransferase TsaA